MKGVNTNNKYSANCEYCGIPFEHEGVSEFETSTELDEALEESDWSHEETPGDDRTWCSPCSFRHFVGYGF